MAQTPENKRCPCDSGFDFLTCCGTEGRTAVNADVLACITDNKTVSNATLTPEMQSAIEAISENPDLYAARVNLFDKKSWFVKMSPAWYQQSVFLDPGRMKGTCIIEADLSSLQTICDAITWQQTSFIFHTAFCGSTLMSQAIERVFNCLSLREPEVLGGLLFYSRSQVDAQDKAVWFERLLKLMSRRYSSKQPVVIKANDNANPIMTDLLTWNSQIPILFMYTPLNEFIAGCLKADNRREWVAQRYQSIKSNLTSVFDSVDNLKIDETSYGERAAVYWSFNVMQYLQGLTLNAGNIKSLDFNDMLENPLASVLACGKLFELQSVDNEAGNENSIEKMNDIFGVYSKNPAFKYSPQQRRDELKKIIEEYPVEQAAGEKIAQTLLDNNYPTNRLPGNLLAT